MADNQIRGTESQDCPSIRVTQSDNCPSIRVRLTGGGGTKAVDPLDVNFYDYDGTCVAAYTAADFAALDAMPGNPSHQGLTAQGWNWSLSDAKAYVAAYGKLNIGQQYITDDGKTRLYINIAEPGRMAVPLNFSQTAANGVTVDWGDGSATETAAGTGAKTITHTYAAPGNYTITLEVTSGTATLGGAGNTGTIGINSNAGKVYNNMLIRAELGEDVTLGTASFNSNSGLRAVTLPSTLTGLPANAFAGCSSLQVVVIPEDVTTLGGFAFANCVSLKVVCYPQTLVSMGNYNSNNNPSLRSATLPSVPKIDQYTFNGAAALASVTIPAGVEEIAASAFVNCASLASVTIPSTVTSIGNSAFSGCHGLAELHLLPTTPPTLGTNALQNFPADAKIYVPAASLATYQGASGWSSYASQMIGE